MKRICGLLLLLLLIFSTISFSCSNSDENDTESIVPLELGNHWCYNSENSDGGQVFSIDVIDEKSINNEKVFVLKRTQESLEETVYYKNKSEGLFYYGRDELELTKPELLFKFPGEIGDVYDWPSINDGEVEIVSINEEITTSGGESFNCYHFLIEYNSVPFIQHYWLSPNVGVVRFEFWEAGVLSNCEELIDFDIL